MFRRRSGVSGETCLACAGEAGVRAFIVPLRRKPLKDRAAKPALGKGGRKADVRWTKSGKEKRRQCRERLGKAQKPNGGTRRT